MADSPKTKKSKENKDRNASLQEESLATEESASTPGEEDEVKEEEEKESTSGFGTGCLSWMFLPKDRKVKCVASDIKSLGKTTKVEKKLLQ